MGRFFYKCFEADAERDLSFLVKTYGFQALDLDFETGMVLLGEGYKACRDERFWQLYCAVFPNMTSDNFQTFEDFKKALTAPAETKSREEILENVEGILDKFNWKVVKI